jgi:uncharacterized protein (TIGR00251 family)
MEVQETPEGLLVSVKVRPNSQNFRLYKKDDKLFLEVASPARENRANQEIVRELSGLLRCGVSILSGLKSKRKLLLLRGISRQDLELFLETH